MIFVVGCPLYYNNQKEKGLNRISFEYKMEEDPDRSFECAICDLKFLRKYHLVRHIATKKHKDKESNNVVTKTFKCSFCTKLFVHASSLSKHRTKCKMKSVVPIKEVEALRSQFEKEKKELEDKIAELQCVNKKKDDQPHPPKSREKRRKISKDIRQQIAEKQENACGECKLTLTPYFQLDHIIGLQFGGTDDKSNLMALCNECHAQKSICENQCRKQIRDAIQTIWREKRTSTLTS